MMKRVGITFAAIQGALFFTLSPLAALAAEGHEGGTGGGLPQMDVALFPGLLFWLAVTFIPLFAIVGTYGLPAVKKTQARRKKVIETDLTAARLANEEAQKVMESYEAALTGARQQAQKTVNNIIQAAQDETTEQRELQSKELTHRIRVAEENIDAARVEAMKDMPRIVNELVMEIVGKVYQTGTTTADATR